MLQSSLNNLLASATDDQFSFTILNSLTAITCFICYAYNATSISVIINKTSIRGELDSYSAYVYLF